MARLPHVLDRFFFEPFVPHKLGVIRVALVGCTLIQVFFLFRGMHHLTLIDAAFEGLHQPSWVIKGLSVPFPLPAGYATRFAAAYYLVGLCALTGLCTRPALVVFSLLNIYLYDDKFSRGVFDHEMGLTTQVLMLLAFVPGSTCFSLDRLLAWLWGRYRQGREPLRMAHLTGPPVSGWGLKLIMILLAFTYFTAGVSKLRYGGFIWLDGKTLAHYLNGNASPYLAGDRPIFMGPAAVPADRKWKDGFGIYSYSWGNKQQSKFWIGAGQKIASSPYLIMGLSVGTVLLELAGFLLLIPGWTRLVYLLSALLMHVIIELLMELTFLKFGVLCLILIDWRWLLSRWGNTRPVQSVPSLP
jgi:hypothetical protein